MRQYLFLIAGLLFALVGYAQTSTITMVTNKAIGDTIFIGLWFDSEDIPNISIEGAEGEIYYLKDTLILTSQTITIKGESIGGLYCGGNELVLLNVSECPTLLELECQSNLLQELNLSGCAELCNLNCSDNQLKELDLSENTELLYLICNNNQLSLLDVSKNTKLMRLGCDYNELSTIHLSNSLELFSCSNNNLKELDLSGTRVLESINCSYNELTSLDLSNTFTFQLLLYGNNFSACALDSIFSQLYDRKITNDIRHSPELRLSLAWLFSVFVKDGDVSLPGADGCREYIATDKNWKVMDINSGNPIEIDNTGRYSCDEIGMSVSDIDAEFSIYPNPVYEDLHINGNTEIKSITIYSLAGKLCKQVRLSDKTNNYSLNLSELSSGVYFFLIETSNGIKSQKIIKR